MGIIKRNDRQDRAMALTTNNNNNGTQSNQQPARR